MEERQILIERIIELWDNDGDAFLSDGHTISKKKSTDKLDARKLEVEQLINKRCIELKISNPLDFISPV